MKHLCASLVNANKCITLCSIFRVKKHQNAFTPSDMYKRSRTNCRIYLITYIIVVSLVLLYDFHTKDRGTTIRPDMCVTGKPCTFPDEVDLRVIVITFNRPESLLKLLRSLDTLVLDGDRAALEIWIDRHHKKGVDQRTLEVASTFRWKGGPTRVHVQVLSKAPTN